MPVLPRDTTLLRRISIDLTAYRKYVLFDLVAPSSLFKYSPRSVTRLISFSSPFFSPVHYQSSSHQMPRRNLIHTRRAPLSSHCRLFLISVEVEQILLDI